MIIKGIATYIAAFIDEFTMVTNSTMHDKHFNILANCYDRHHISFNPIVIEMLEHFHTFDDHHLSISNCCLSQESSCVPAINSKPILIR